MTTAEITPVQLNSERVHSFSRFFGQKLYISGAYKFWGTWTPTSIPFSPKDMYFTVTSGVESRLDLVSYKFYQTPELWWVLADVNQIFFPAEELTVGTVLRIPSKTTLITMGISR
jgi:hypothetical protein